MSLFIDLTDNANILKFVFPETLTDGSFEYDEKSNSKSPLIQQLFSFPFVKKVYITANFIAIQKIDGVEWEHLTDQLKEILQLHHNNESIFASEPKSNMLAYSLYAEMTPNPASMKFVANQILVSEIIEIKNKEEAQEVPLALELFDFSYVKEVFLSENYVSVIKDDSVEWLDINLEIRERILSFLRSGREITTKNYQPRVTQEVNLDQRKFTEIEQKIKNILTEYIKPAVANDGGNIDLIKFDEKTQTAHMLLQGSCSGCPSSTITLKNGVQSMLENMMPGEVKDVIAVNG